TCFARCHHGHVYYPTERFADLVHPHLQRPNLLGEQIEACHARGIRVPIYITVQWDHLQSRRHRDWIMVDENGADVGGKPLTPGFYHFLDVSHPGYRRFLFDMVVDLVANVPAVDGFFFDITQSRFSYATHWLDGLRERGLDVHSEHDRDQFARDVMDTWKREMTAFIRGLPGCQSEETTIFYNAGHVGPKDRVAAEAFTHFELESLPSGGWGYMHFPTATRYARTLGKPILGMTGKFHTTWGDFGSLKNRPALDFECLQMAAHGAVCSVGDQLHPRGTLDPATYRLIGETYDKVRNIEPWCIGNTPMTEIALLTPEGMTGPGVGGAAQGGKLPEAIAAANRVLQELAFQFSIVSDADDLSPYRLVIIPEGVPLVGELAQKLEAYHDAGGTLVLIAPDGAQCDPGFLADVFSVEVEGDAATAPEFVRLGKGFATELDASAYVMYRRGRKLSQLEGSKVLASSEPAYFDRTAEHFCSHQHAPSTMVETNPAILRSRHGRAITFAHPLFLTHFDNAARWCKVMLATAIELIMPGRLVRHDGPSTLLCHLTHQPHEQRRVLHLLHYVPERRGKEFDVIEDVLPLHNLTVSIEADKVVAATLQPEGLTLDADYADGRLSVRVPKLEGHAMIVLDD
ncbi:MAG: alpha-amylase family protein, partial [Planctomycetota bacterium]